MTGHLLISVRPGEALAALLKDGRMVWFDFIRTLNDSTPSLAVGTVCLGRVRRVEPGLQAAFVDLDGSQTALLAAKDARLLLGKSVGERPIERMVHEGEALLVRVSRAGRGGKGPRVTADLALPPPLREEIEAKARRATAPSVLWRPPAPDPAVQLWRMAPAAAGSIEVDHEPSAAALRRALARSGADIAVSVSGEDVFSAHGLAEEVDGLSVPVVPLAGGGSLIIEPAAALIAIDVNAGGALGSTAEHTALKVNLDAAREIARQIVLRHLGGIVVIDFLRLKAARHRREVVNALRAALENDGLSAQISDIGPAGLVALVIPHRGVPLHERTRSPCLRCGGRGMVPDLAGQALCLLARIAREARSGGAGPLEARAAPEVIDWLETRADATRRELERFAVSAVSWRREPGWPPERIDVRRRH